MNSVISVECEECSGDEIEIVSVTFDQFLQESVTTTRCKNCGTVVRYATMPSQTGLQVVRLEPTYEQFEGDVNDQLVLFNSLFNSVEEAFDARADLRLDILNLRRRHYVTGIEQRRHQIAVDALKAAQAAQDA